MSVVVNRLEFSNGLDRSVERFEERFRSRVRQLMSVGMKRLIAKTPVNTGEAVMNYVATGGSPYGGPPKKAGEPVEPTNHLALGAEQLRGPAMLEALSTLGNVDYRDPFKKFYITNRAPHIGGLESGALPHAPYEPRSPNGMFGVTLIELAAALQSGRI